MTLSNRNFINRNFKIIILGDASTGKTALVNSYCKKEFNSNYQCTIATDFILKTESLDNGDQVDLLISDTSGQNRTLTKRSISADTDACLLTYDITNLNTLQNAEQWLQAFCEATKNSDAIILLVGTKNDLESNRQVSREDAEKFVKHCCDTSNRRVILLDEISVKNSASVGYGLVKMIAQHIYENKGLHKTAEAVVEKPVGARQMRQYLASKEAQQSIAATTAKQSVIDTQGLSQKTDVVAQKPIAATIDRLEDDSYVSVVITKRSYWNIFHYPRNQQAAILASALLVAVAVTLAIIFAPASISLALSGLVLGGLSVLAGVGYYLRITSNEQDNNASSQVAGGTHLQLASAGMPPAVGVTKINENAATSGNGLAAPLPYIPPVGVPRPASATSFRMNRGSDDS